MFPHWWLICGSTESPDSTGVQHLLADISTKNLTRIIYSKICLEQKLRTLQKDIEKPKKSIGQGGTKVLYVQCVLLDVLDSVEQQLYAQIKKSSTLNITDQ